MALERWDTTLREFAEAGGRTPTFEERRSAIINILPESFRHEVFFRLPAMQDDMVNGSQEEQDMAYMALRQQLQSVADDSVHSAPACAHSPPGVPVDLADPASA